MGGSDGRIIIDTALDATGFEKGSAKLDRACESMVKQVNKLGVDLKKGFSSPAQVDSFSAKVDSVKGTVAELDARLCTLGAQTFTTPAMDALIAQMDKAKLKADEVGAKIESAIAAQFQQFRDLGATPTLESTVSTLERTSEEFRKLEKEAEAAQEKIDGLAEKMRELEQSGEGVKLGSDTQQYAEMKDKVDSAAASLDEFQDKAASAGTSGGGGGILSTISGISAKVAPILYVAKEIFKVVKKIIAGLEKTLKSILSRTWAVMKGIWKAASGIAKTIGSGIMSKLTKGESLFEKLSAAAEEAKGKLVSFFTRLVSMVKTRVIRKAISDIMQGVQDAMKTLAAFSADYNRSMSMITNASTELRANLASAFGQIVNIVAPVLTRIIDMFSTAVSYIAAFFAMLSGKKSIAVAKKQTADYAGSLEKTADAADDAKKALASFDEINNISEQKDKGGDSGSSAGDLYEDIPIADLLPDSIKNLFERIKAAIKAGDWEGVGEIVAEGLNKALKAIDDWINEKLRPEGVKWAERIARILNGLVDKLDWKLLGKTIADTFNAVFDIVGKFLSTFDFRALAQGLSKGLNSLVEHIEPDTIGKAIGSALAAAIDFVSGINIAWGRLGSVIGQGIKQAIQSVSGRFLEFGEDVSAIVQGLFIGISIAAATVPWEEIGVDIGMFLAGIDWVSVLSEVGTAIGTALSGILNSVGTALDIFSKNGGFAKLGAGIAAAISNVLTGVGGYDFADVLLLLINGIIDAMTALVNSGEWDKVKKGIFGCIKKLLVGIKWAEAAQAITTFINDMIDEITDFVDSEEWTKVQTEVLNAIMYLIENIDWEKASSTFVKFVNAIVGKIVEFVTSDSFADVVKAITDAISELDWEGIAKIWSEILWTKFKIKLEKIIGSVQGLVDSIGLNNGSRNSHWAQETGYDVGESAVAGYAAGVNANGGFGGATGRAMSQAATAANKALQINSPSKVFEQIGAYTAEGFANGVSSGENDILRTISNISTAMQDGMSDKVIGLDDSKLYGVLSVLDKIAAKLADISGGLRLPAMAAGTVIPYRARIAEDGATTSGTDAPMTSEGGGIVELLRQALAQGVTLHLTEYLDGEKIFDGVVERSTQSYKRTGRYVILGE